MRLAVPILPVHEMQRAIAFYRALGFVATRYENSDEYAFLTRGALEIHLRHAPDLRVGENPSGVYILLDPGTAAPLQAEFQAAGISLLSPLAQRAWKMNEFVLADPEGNLLRFGEPV